MQELLPLKNEHWLEDLGDDEEPPLTVEIAVEAVFSLLPYSPPRTIRPELPLEMVLTRLAALPPERCVMHLRYLAAHHDSVYWQNDGRTQAAYHRATLRFTSGDVALTVSIAPLPPEGHACLLNGNPAARKQ